MAEYIKREAVIDLITRRYENPEICTQEINSIPAADVAPVVRCKNCVHYDLGVCLKIYSDGNAHPEAWQPRRLEDFCSYGERKDEANES